MPVFSKEVWILKSKAWLFSIAVPLTILCTEGGENLCRTMFTFGNNSLELGVQELPKTRTVRVKNNSC